MSRTVPRITLLCLLLCALYMPSANAVDVEQRPELRSFIDEMVKQHDFDRVELTRLFTQVDIKPAIIESIRSPAEKKPWRDYRPIFVNPARIHGGVEFWNAHAPALARAESVYGVAPEIIVAIIGVETRYGKNTGGYRVLVSNGSCASTSAVATLTVNLPAAGSFSQVSRTPGGPFNLKLTGTTGAYYEIQSNTNLNNTNAWSTIAFITNSGGMTVFNDSTATNAPQKFYRALAR